MDTWSINTSSLIYIFVDSTHSTSMNSTSVHNNELYRVRYLSSRHLPEPELTCTLSLLEKAEEKTAAIRVKFFYLNEKFVHRQITKHTQHQL